jgi:hypothetical protein
MFRLFLLLIFVSLISCTSTKATSEIPPVGTIWENDLGYEEVYTVPEVLPQPKVGNLSFLQNVNSAMNGTTCMSMDPFSFMIVVYSNGSVIGIHNKKRSADPCFTVGAYAIAGHLFSPAKLNGEPVKALFSIRVVPKN